MSKELLFSSLKGYKPINNKVVWSYVTFNVNKTTTQFRCHQTSESRRLMEAQQVNSLYFTMRVDRSNDFNSRWCWCSTRTLTDTSGKCTCTSILKLVSVDLSLVHISVQVSRKLLSLSLLSSSFSWCPRSMQIRFVQQNRICVFRLLVFSRDVYYVRVFVLTSAVISLPKANL